mgnify:CR=1 FL=1
MATIGIVIESEGEKVKETNFGVITAARGGGDVGDRNSTQVILGDGVSGRACYCCIWSQTDV